MPSLVWVVFIPAEEYDDDEYEATSFGGVFPSEAAAKAWIRADNKGRVPLTYQCEEVPFYE